MFQFNSLLDGPCWFSSVQSLSRVQLFATPWTAARQASLSITNSRSPPKPMSIESVMPSNNLILCHPLLLPSIFPSIRVFSSESALHIRSPKYWSFSFNISPSSEYSQLISFRIDWLDLLAVQGILKSLLQHHSSKASILRCSALFILQLSHPYMTTGKTLLINSLEYTTFRAYSLGLPGSSVVKNLLANVGDVGLIPESGRYPGGGNGNPLQYPCLGNPTDRGAWQDMT